jgi:tetratricopeptide (TPR) repeat protein
MTPLIEVEKRPPNEVVYNKVENVFVYQDRTKDDDKSFKRFTRDKELLYAEHLKNPDESRTLFYLAQTCGCLGQHDESYKYYIKRLKAGGFFEEIFHAYYRLGDASELLGHSWEETFMWYMKAFQHSQRAEPLYKIAKHYETWNMHGEKKPEWHTCYMYASMACDLTYPTEQILFIDKNIYSYARWHLLGISAYYGGKYKEGKEACLKAIEAKNMDIDKFNLKHYMLKEAELLTKGNTDKTSNSLYAHTIFDKEIRTKDELERNHERMPIINETLEKVKEEFKNRGAPLTDEQFNKMKILNTNSLVSYDSLNNPGFNNNQPQIPLQPQAYTQQQIPNNLSRKDKRALLRQMINKKASERKNIKLHQ